MSIVTTTNTAELAVEIHELTDSLTENGLLIAILYVRLGCVVARARDAFTKDVDFGKWWDAQEFKINGRLLNAHDRAALISFGRDPDRAMEVLGETKRTSIKHIFLNEFKSKAAPLGQNRSVHVDKPQSAPEVPSFSTQNNPSCAQIAQDTLKSMQEHDRRAKRTTDTDYRAREQQIAKVLADRVANGGALPTSDEVMDEFNVGTSTAGGAVRIVDFHLRETASAPSADPEVDPATLPKSYQEKLEILERRLNKEFEVRVREKADEIARGYMESRIIPQWREAVEFFNSYQDNWGRFNVATRAPFSRQEFNLLLRAIHPDTAASCQTEALQLLRSKQARLVLPEPGAVKAPTVPSTLADLDARKAAADAERRAKRSKVAAG